MPKRTVADVDVTGKRVFIRVDFNVPLADGGARITDDRRIVAAVPTIRSVLDRGGRAILASHLGRPEGVGPEPGQSLRPAATRLAELLGLPVGFPSDDCVDQAAADAVAALPDGGCLLLENLRFHKAEKKGDPAFAARLAASADVYVNDAFGTAHREDASMVAVPRAMPAEAPKVSGFLMEKEIRYLSEALASPARPFVVVLGGAKVSDKLPAIHNLLGKADAILVGGAMAYTFLKARGVAVGTSRVEQEMLDEAAKILDQAARANVDLHLPEDHVCGTAFSEAGGDVQVFDDAIRDGFMGLDIGPRTRARYAEILHNARTIVWNGPMGVFEWAAFRDGTRQVGEAIVEATSRGATSIVGGGDSAAAAEQFGLADRLSHVSTGGGASLEMLEGKRFTAVDLLDDA